MYKQLNNKGEFHCENGPAYIDDSGNKYWLINGKHHREDGPAVEYYDGAKSWYINGKCHREDGPAIERSNGAKYWFYNGKNVNCSSNEEFLKLMRLKAFW